jgi:hypothetical protein
MTILQNRRTVFDLSSSDVISSAAPSSEAGIEKSDGQDGFFIYTSKVFDLWFKDENGAWSLHDSYGIPEITDGVAFSWNNNTAAFVRTQEASHQIAVFIIETKTVGSFGNQEQTTLSSVGYDRLSEHSNYKRIRMQNSGHTGEAYAIAVFDANGDASYISAPVSGQREGKALGWDENGALGWVSLTPPAVPVTTPSQYWDSNSTSTELGSNTITLGGATLSTTDGKYGSSSFSFGASGNKQPMTLASDIDLSTGIYTFSLWFKNKRSGNSWGSVLRQAVGASGATTANYPIMARSSDDALGIFKREDGSNTFHSSGYDMTSLEGDTNWNHLAVVADGTNSTFYVNGSQVGSVVAKVTTTSVGEIGSHTGGAQVFAEGIDELAYWDSALTAEQVATIYNSADKLSVLAPAAMPEASYENAQSTGTLGQGATVVNGMYLDPNTRGQGYSQGTWTNDMRPDNSADDFSFSGYWRIKTANDNDRGWLFGREGNISAGGWGIFVKKRSETTMAYEIVMAGGNPTFITDDITTNIYDEFHHASFAYSDGEWKFYHDGVLVYTKTGVNMATTNPSGGKYKLGNGWAVIALDEITLFKNVYLTTGQITSLASERSQKDTDYTNNT